jgi:hypothetical protein
MQCVSHSFAFYSTTPAQLALVVKTLISNYKITLPLFHVFYQTAFSTCADLQHKQGRDAATERGIVLKLITHLLFLKLFSNFAIIFIWLAHDDVTGLDCLTPPRVLNYLNSVTFSGNYCRTCFPRMSTLHLANLT